MKKFIPVTKIYSGREEQEAVARVVASGWILQGPRVKEFELLLARYINVPFAVTTSSATSALHLSLIILGIGPGDEVIVPSLSFIASANCIVHAGATPVFVDIDPKTYNLDPNKVEQLITKHTRAIIAVHQIGLPADMEKILVLAKKNKLAVIEDAACALGACIGKRHVGTFGDFGAFSFHPRKAITTAEGGMLVTKNATWAKQAQMLRAHGASISVTNRHLSKKVIHESYPIIGYNYRMSDIHAALGIAQFKKINAILQGRARVARQYNKALKDHPRIVTPFVPHGFTHSWQSYQIRLPGVKSKRTMLMQKLLDKGIATRTGVMASHLEKPYLSMYPRLRLPETEKAAAETLILPLYPQMTKDEQEYVINNLLKILTVI